MYLYRICDKEEYESILKNKSFKEVGTKGIDCINWSKKYHLNTHNYQKDKNYLHFYDEKDNVYYQDTKKGRIIYVLDIDEDKVNNYLGFGTYFNASKLHKEDVIEYAIDTDSLSYQDICLVQEVTGEISLSDVLFDMAEDSLKMVYQKK